MISYDLYYGKVIRRYSTKWMDDGNLGRSTARLHLDELRRHPLAHVGCLRGGFLVVMHLVHAVVPPEANLGTYTHTHIIYIPDAPSVPSESI